MNFLASFASNGWSILTNNGKRRDSGSNIRSTDTLVGDQERRKLIEASRDMWRNFPVAAWAIRKHLDFVSTFNFHPQTGNRELDMKLKRMMKERGRAGAVEVTGKHSLQQFIRIAESRRLIDNDVLLVKRRDGLLQAIQSDRVRTPGIGYEVNKEGIKTEVHGVVVNQAGKARGYRIYRKLSPYSGYEYETTVPSNASFLHGYFDEFDQVRGTSPLLSSLETFADTLEVTEYARLKAKVTQLFALAITREAPTYSGENCSDGYEVDFTKGPIKLDMDPGDKAEFLESKHPSTEFQQYVNLSMQMALKSLDIPWSFFDESFTTYYGSRTALIHYLESCRHRRLSNEQLLNWITDWYIGRWKREGVLPRTKQIDYRWIPAGVPWWDPSKEVTADAMSVGNTFRSRSEIRMEKFGDNWEDVVDQIALENEYLASKGLDPAMTIPGQTNVQEKEEPSQPEEDEDGEE
jgi:capsid protein